MSRPDGGPAFPCKWENELAVNQFAPDGRLVPGEGIAYLQGMSLRDWFAGQALTGMMACESEDFCITGDAQHTVEEKRAKAAYEQADAMLAARSRVDSPR